MNDPHVESLRYRLEVDEDIARFENPPALEDERDAYRLRLENGVLTVEMREHHPTPESARERVEPLLKAWELSAGFMRDRIWLKFVFEPEGTKIVDRHPLPSEPGELRPHTLGAFVRAEGTATAAIARRPLKEYPKPPRGFEVPKSPKGVSDLEVLFDRYQRAVWEDQSQLLSVGYVCLSYLEGTTGLSGSAGARGEVVRRYRIERPVLKKLGDLVSEHGNIQEARKLDVGAKLTPLMEPERLWVQAAIKTLIRRKAEYDHDPGRATSLPEITMSDLPPL